MNKESEDMVKREKDLRDAAREILSDFNRYGEVLQKGDNGEYGMESAIGRLNSALIQYDDRESCQNCPYLDVDGVCRSRMGCANQGVEPE